MPDIPIINAGAFAAMTPTEQSLFNAFRKSMVSLFSDGGSSNDPEMLGLIEDAAIIFVDEIDEMIKNPPPPAPPAAAGTT